MKSTAIRKKVSERMADEKAKEEAALKIECEKLAIKRYTKEQLDKWTKEFGAIWYLPVLDAKGGIEKMMVMKPITREALGYATSKIEGEGIYAFLEAAMRECKIDGDEEILDDDDYFLPASSSFNKIVEGKKTAMLKR